MRHENHIVIKKPNAFSVIGQIEEIQHTKKEDKTGREIVRIDAYPRTIALQDFLENKGQNRNIAISGMARSGKTYLLYWLLKQLKEFKTERGKVIPLHRIIFQAKDSDRFKELGIPTLFLKHYVPNVFQDPNAFIMAWRLAFSLTMKGITAVRIEPKLLEIITRLCLVLPNLSSPSDCPPSPRALCYAPHVFQSWGLRVRLRRPLRGSLRSPCSARSGRGFAGKPLKFQQSIYGLSFAITFLKRKFNQRVKFWSNKS